MNFSPLDNAVLDLWAEGQSATTITRRLSLVSRQDVDSVIRRAKRTKDQRADGHVRGSTAWPPDKVEVLRGLAAKRLTARQIGLRMGISRNCVIGKCQRENIELSSGSTGGKRLPKTFALKVARMTGLQSCGLASAIKRRQSRPPSSPSVSIPKAVLTAPDTKPTTLLARTPFECAWVIGETAGPDTECCGAPIMWKSWCAFHASAGTTPRPPKSVRGFSMPSIPFAELIR